MGAADDGMRGGALRAVRDVPAHVWLLAAAGVSAWWLWRRRPARPPVPDTAENREWLARILMTEQSFHNRAPDESEWLGIAWVAINRAARGSGRIRDVVDGRAWFGAASPPRLVSATILTSGNGPHAVALSAAIFEGRLRNPIGRREHFIHVAPFSRCMSEGAVSGGRGQFVCARVDGYGLRRIPRWAVGRDSPGGRAQFPPVRVGTALYA